MEQHFITFSERVWPRGVLANYLVGTRGTGQRTWAGRATDRTQWVGQSVCARFSTLEEYSSWRLQEKPHLEFWAPTPKPHTPPTKANTDACNFPFPSKRRARPKVGSECQNASGHFLTTPIHMLVIFLLTLTRVTGDTHSWSASSSRSQYWQWRLSKGSLQ